MGIVQDRKDLPIRKEGSRPASFSRAKEARAIKQKLVGELKANFLANSTKKAKARKRQAVEQKEAGTFTRLRKRPWWRSRQG